MANARWRPTVGKGKTITPPSAPALLRAGLLASSVGGLLDPRGLKELQDWRAASLACKTDPPCSTFAFFFSFRPPRPWPFQGFLPLRLADLSLEVGGSNRCSSGKSATTATRVAAARQAYQPLHTDTNVLPPAEVWLLPPSQRSRDPAIHLYPYRLWRPRHEWHPTPLTKPPLTTIAPSRQRCHSKKPPPPPQGVPSPFDSSPGSGSNSSPPAVPTRAIVARIWHLFSRYFLPPPHAPHTQNHSPDHGDDRTMHTCLRQAEPPPPPPTPKAQAAHRLSWALLAGAG